MTDRIDYFIARCGVTWEGCFCGLDKGHGGLHECIACASEWTDADCDKPPVIVRCRICSEEMVVEAKEENHWYETHHC